MHCKYMWFGGGWIGTHLHLLSAEGHSHTNVLTGDGWVCAH